MFDERSWPVVLTALLEGGDLSVSQADWAMGEFMTGNATHAQMGAFLIALQRKGVTVDEIVGFRDAILAEAREIKLPAMSLDIVGTGGDRFGTVNISTMASVIAAASGIPVVKHGNKAASSKSGSSDVLTALGIDLTLEPDAAVPMALIVAEAVVNALEHGFADRDSGAIRIHVARRVNGGAKVGHSAA